MRAREFIIEAQHSIRDQIIHAVDINGGSLDDYFVRFTKRDHLGFSDQQTFGRFPDVDDPDFDIDRITAQARGRRVLWFYPLKTYLSAREGTYAMDFPYVWLVKLKPNAWLQTVRSGDREVKPAPAGKERVGILRMSFTPAALFFKHGFDLIGKYYDYAGQHQRHGQVKRMAEDRENYNGLNILLQQDEDEVFVKASAGGRELGHVLFVQDGEYLMPQDLEVDERYRGQGIAAAMYDYVKSQGYKIRRSGQQTDAGAGFWAKHRAEQNVWEQGVAEGTESYPEVLYHGSTQEIKGPLTPRQAHDIGGAKRSNKNAIYATDDPNFAIAYSLAERGSDTGTLGWRKDPRLIFFGGKIRHGQNVYLHVLPTKNQQGKPLFTKGAADAEWYSLPSVKEITPTEVKTLPVDQYLHLLRKPTSQEQKIFQANKAKAKQGVAEALRNSGYKEIEFVCANPEFPEATDPNLQKQMYAGLQQIPGVIPLFQDQSDWSEGQYSLTAIYKDRAVRGAILKLAKQLGVKVDLEQPVSDDYVDRAIRGEHEGQQHMAEGRDFDRCFDQACKLYDRAVGKHLKPKLVQVADFQGDGSGADPRWGKLPQHVWQHYVVIVGDQVLDPTAQQFGPDMPKQYPVSDLDRLWGKQYQIRPRENMAEGSHNLNYIGNCTDDDVIEHIFGDATGFAQAVEEYGDEFVLDDLVVKYDPETDVHSFYYKKQGVAEDLNQPYMFYRGEPILSPDRLKQLQASVGKPYPILRKAGSAANIGTYMSPDGEKATSFVQQALAGQGKGGSVTKIAVDPGSFQQGDGGIDEAVIITNIAGLVSRKDPDPNDPLRIKDRKQAMLHYLGPGVQKYLNDPLINNPKLVQQWYDPEFAKSNWNTIKSGKQAVTKPGQSKIQEKMIQMLDPLAEKIRRDPEVIKYFLTHNPGDWVEYNFRMNSDGSGTKVVGVKYYPPAKKQGMEENQLDEIDWTDAAMMLIPGAGVIGKAFKAYNTGKNIAQTAQAAKDYLDTTDSLNALTKQQAENPPVTNIPAEKIPDINPVDENFADGRNPQHKGDSARHGIPKHATIAQLEKIRSSKTASPRKKQLAHWQINMRRGKAKR